MLVQPFPGKKVSYNILCSLLAACLKQFPKVFSASKPGPCARMASRSESLIVSSLRRNKALSFRNFYLLEVFCTRNQPLFTVHYGFSILSCSILVMKERI